MKGSQSSNKITSVDVRIGGHYVRVHLTEAADELARKYKLSQPMLRTLAADYGGYPIADTRMLKALVRRGFFEEKQKGFFHKTELYKQVCPLLFRIEKLV